ncbi:MAG TPA: TIGR02302 family protein [Rhizobiales bacterium]|nr:TIGR02302 family protein [Hyphomicrobiales bacterium]
MMRSVFRPKTTPPEGTEDSALGRRLERRVLLSRLALLGERIWEALLWPFIVVCAFLVVSLLELWSVLPALLHRAVLGAFGLALLVSLLPLIRLSLPTRVEALRRLERNANVKHRPASSYEDRLGATPPKETALLWAAHRERLARLVAELKPSWPAPRTDRKDPYAIRAALLLAVVAAMLAAGGNGFDRLRAAFSPGATSGTPALLRLDAWVTPPIYTGIPPIVLADGSERVGAGSESFRALSVPERSELIVRTHAPQGETVSLTMSNDDGSDLKTIEPKQGGAQGLVEFDVALTQPISADVKISGQTVSKWRFELIKDEAPTISLMGNPTTTPRGALRLVFRADDDHGVASAEAHFALSEGEAGNLAPLPAEAGAKVEPDPLLQPPVMSLQLPHANAKRADGRATQDLTAHPWAGLKVRMTLAARDQAGQSGESVPYEFVLPERTFTKPLAKAVVEQRKRLVREPDSVESVSRALEALTLGGEKVIDDSFIYLSLRDAYWRLASDDSRASVASVVDQLWTVALRIEDGDLPEAERDVKTAQDALAEGLKENASPEEIKRLVDELRTALSRYLQALASQAQEKGNMPAQDKQNGDQLVSQQDLDKILKNIEKLAQSGSKDMAQQMLSELKDILDRLQTGNFPESAQQQRASRMMKDLSEVISKQQKLLDDTFKAKREQNAGNDQNQGGQFEVSPPGQPLEFGPGMSMAPLFEVPGDAEPGSEKGQGSSGKQVSPRGSGQAEQGMQPPGPGQHPSQNGQLGDRQEELRNKLQSLTDRLRIDGANPPQEFEGAQEAMKEAKQELGDGNLDSATQSQSLALERLRKGAQSMAEQMMQNGDAQAGQGPGNNGRDPLGRPDRSNRPDLGLSVKVPDEIDIQRAREVLDELRRRLGDPARPAFELDYLERLIKPF